MILALTIFGWSTIARLLRGSILSIREAEYVEAARSLGASSWRVVTRHILSNSFAPVLIFVAFSVGTAVIAEASLSYLGVGVKPDVPEWGNMIATALDVRVQAQIMDLLESLQEQRGTAIVLITDDLGLVASHADR